MVSKKSKIVCLVKVSRLELVFLPFADKLQPIFYKLPCLEQKITKVDWKSTMYSAVKCPWIFVFILFCVIFYLFLLLFIYTINIKYWQVLFITWKQIGKSYSATSTFKCCGSTGAVLVWLFFGCPIANFWPLLRKQPHSFDVNHYVLSMFDLKVTGSLIKWFGP